MNTKEHVTLAVILLIGIYFLLEYLHIGGFFSYAATIIIGSVLPDMIEPAIHYTHRNYFHSKRFLKILYYTSLGTLIIGLLFHNFLYVFFLVLGYISHLWLDSTTKMGLPD